MPRTSSPSSSERNASAFFLLVSQIIKKYLKNVFINIFFSCWSPSKMASRRLQGAESHGQRQRGADPVHRHLASEVRVQDRQRWPGGDAPGSRCSTSCQGTVFLKFSRFKKFIQEAAYAFAKQTKPDIADEPKQALAQSKNMAAAIAKKAIAVLAWFLYTWSYLFSHNTLHWLQIIFP